MLKINQVQDSIKIKRGIEMKEKEKEISKLYRDNYDVISSLKIDEDLKDKMLEVNSQLYNLSMTDINIKKTVSIFIDNVCQNTIDIIIDVLIGLINDYKLCDKKAKILDNCFHSFEKNEFVVIKDFNFAKNEYRLERVKEDIINYDSFFIMAKEGSFDNGFLTDRDLNSRITIRIKGKDYSTEEILVDVKHKLNENNVLFNISDSEWRKIISSSLESDCCNNVNCADYLFKRAVNAKILGDLDIIDGSCFGYFSKYKIKISDLVGLKNVKKEIASLKNYLSMQKRIGNRISGNYLNMLFLGNPGTGKTTVGRIYAEILYELGYIKENKLVEIIPTDLMANYVGQTKDKTRKILNNAKGGVLFIDEAYLIAGSSGRYSYMEEAVVELMKYMENPENVIIFAGYPLETKKIYDVNPGMKSRICKEIIFDDYDENELYNILKNNLKKLGFKVSPNGVKAIKKIIKIESQKKNFGNARYCNVLMQSLLMNYANRNTLSDTYEITDKDVKIDDEINFQMGFKEVN